MQVCIKQVRGCYYPLVVFYRAFLELVDFAIFLMKNFFTMTLTEDDCYIITDNIS